MSLTTASYHPTLKELPSDSRPRERLRQSGPALLSDAELLAIILRVGTPGETVLELAQRLLRTYGGWSGLARANFDDLCRERGLGEAKTCQLKAALEIGRRLSVGLPQDRPVIRSADDVAALVLFEMGALEQEHLRVILLNTKNQVVKIEPVYIGSVNSAQVRTAELFREAIRQNCAHIILVHNHPSGDPFPSPVDVEMTTQAVAAGRLLEIEVLDHLIIGEQRYISLRERNLGFGN